MVYTQTFTIRWSECDANGHLRNTAYSEYGIETRLGFLAGLGWPYARFVEHGIGPVILREEIDYLRELHLGQTVEVSLRALGGSPDGARFKLVHGLVAEGETAARIVLGGGGLDLRRRRLAAPPAELHQAMQTLDRIEPFEELPPARRRED